MIYDLTCCKNNKPLLVSVRNHEENLLMNRISALRNRSGIKQTALAGALGWSQSRLSNYESGTRIPGLYECRAITVALNKLGTTCTLDDVFPPEHDVPEAA